LVGRSPTQSGAAATHTALSSLHPSIPANRIDPVGAAILATYQDIAPNINPGADYAPYTNKYEILGGETAG
jgi:hypothetical protein